MNSGWRSIRKEKMMKYSGLNKRALIFLIYDILLVQVASFLALFIRFDFTINEGEIHFFDTALRMTPATTVIVVASFFACRLYTSVWKYASINELCNIIMACCFIFVLDIACFNIFEARVPRSYYFLTILIIGIGTLASRFGYRLLRILKNRAHSQKTVNVMIVGAGEAGRKLSEELKGSNHSNYAVKCFIDDDNGMHGKYLNGVKIVGGRDDIVRRVQKYDIEEIFIAMPSVSRSKIRDIVEICQKTGCRVKTLPGIYQLANGEVMVSKLRDVNIEDLLGRDTVLVNSQELRESIEGKVVLVTGGGGSIGSELCRQIAGLSPKQLIIVDIYENNAYEIQQELKRTNPELNLVTLIASVRNTHRMNRIFEDYRPQIVFHAAAHKHVPLMEDSPNEAIKNNVFGTYKTAMAAGKYGAERFVLISTDKAVNPTNIMGASKRICEMIVQTMDKKFDTEYVAVRFGNVLGSNGSVIPLFKKQIMEGGPVTVTHPDIIRYFMTIPEAVSLVLQAEAYAEGGEIFVLDMGQPVRILDLAKNLIRLSGYEPGKDIEIKFTGLRPGEKLYEEMLMEEEGMRETPNHMIFIGRPIDIDEDVFTEQLTALKDACYEDADDIKLRVSDIVKTYRPPEK